LATPGVGVHALGGRSSVEPSAVHASGAAGAALTVPEVYALADVGARYRALVLLGVFGSLRWGELAALRRSDINAQARTVRFPGS
jgi:integrase